jgi:hypothetical protein
MSLAVTYLTCNRAFSTREAHRSGGEFEKIAAVARSSGGMHHRLEIGDGCVVIADEWATVEQFELCFTGSRQQTIIGRSGRPWSARYHRRRGDLPHPARTDSSRPSRRHRGIGPSVLNALRRHGFAAIGPVCKP